MKTGIKMQVNVNCRQNDSKAWCKDKRVPRSLFGLGARVCCMHNGTPCPFQDPYNKPINHPPGQKGTK